MISSMLSGMALRRDIGKNHPSSPNDCDHPAGVARKRVQKSKNLCKQSSGTRVVIRILKVVRTCVELNLPKYSCSLEKYTVGVTPYYCQPCIRFLQFAFLDCGFGWCCSSKREDAVVGDAAFGSHGRGSECSKQHAQNSCFHRKHPLSLNSKLYLKYALSSPHGMHFRPWTGSSGSLSPLSWEP